MLEKVAFKVILIGIKKVIENDENYDGSVREGEVENQDESYDYKEGGR
jgi:hypothetical protein